MTAIRSVRAAEGKFVQVSNVALQDSRLSWRARGILAFVLSMPPDQTLTAKWLESQAPDGREAVRGALRELARYGYYHRERHKGPRGIWVWDQVLSDAPLTVSEQTSETDPFAQENTTYGNPSAGKPSDGNPSDKRPNTEDPKYVGPVDLASRRARAKAASATLTVPDAINAVRRAAAIEYGSDEANEISDEDALGLFFTYVQPRRPRDLVAYLGKIFADAPHLDTLLAGSEARCTQCQKRDSNCECPAALDRRALILGAGACHQTGRG